MYSPLYKFTVIHRIVTRYRELGKNKRENKGGNLDGVSFYIRDK